MESLFVESSIETIAAASRIYRYYDPSVTENNVSEEVYNQNGDFLEEIREIRNLKNLPVAISYHLDDKAGSSPWFNEIFEYDTSDRMLLNHKWKGGKTFSMEKNQYSSAGKLLKKNA
ncbi:MAG: hypothetical protein M3R17_18165 [Bacteroidota bacterium]|nr:hypothetical protein [Bacteroidota bacterium]